MTPAPYNSLPGDKLPLARAFWLRTEDGVRLRAGHWQAEPRIGTVLLFNGRTEFLEKYEEVATDLNSAGYDVLSLDWRGQGLSDRLLKDPRPSHVARFADYQRDVVELIIAAQELNLPKPWHLLAHSMGGALGLAALADGLPVATAVFTAPMWGINLHGLPLWVAKALAKGADKLGFGAHPAILSGGYECFILKENYTANPLTQDGLRWCRLLAQTVQWPEIALGGATYHWVGEALEECARLMELPAPEVPTLVAFSPTDPIISPAAIRARVASWPGVEAMELEGCRHEPMIERNLWRTPFLEAAVAHFDKAIPAAT